MTHKVYDTRGRLADLVTTTETNGLVRTLQDVHYTFRGDDSISSVLKTHDVDTEGGFCNRIEYSYRYDGLGRIIHACGACERERPHDTLKSGFERGYKYSPSGNIISRTIHDPDTHTIIDEWSCSFVNHAVTGIDSSAFGTGRLEMEYDRCGNMILQRDRSEGSVKAFTCDSLNRIRTVRDPERDITMGEYNYDDSGFRVRKRALRRIGDKPVPVLFTGASDRPFRKGHPRYRNSGKQRVS